MYETLTDVYINIQMYKFERDSHRKLVIEEKVDFDGFSISSGF